MNIAEKRIPLDGRFEYSFGGVTVDIRVSTLPTTYGEKTVLRLLGTALGKNITLADLGMTKENVEKFTRITKAPNGIILVTGPTGSGKSTTLYTVLNELNTPEVNITTIEDPVEKKVLGINQVQTNDKAGMDFTAGLRSILRQDPDIIMIGEIRDKETADITIRAAITGHLVLSTLHTNDSVATIARLVDMGIEPYMVAAAVNGIMAQRLLKILCPKCKEKIKISEFHKKVLKDPTIEEVYKPVGCASCSYTGYSGRTAVHEVLELTPEIRDMISKNRSIDEIKDYCRQQGMEFLDENIRKKIKAGITSVEEYMKLIYTSM
jgi:type IV pilus assembly protein PilB